MNVQSVTQVQLCTIKHGNVKHAPLYGPGQCPSELPSSLVSSNCSCLSARKACLKTSSSRSSSRNHEASPNRMRKSAIIAKVWLACVEGSAFERRGAQWSYCRQVSGVQTGTSVGAFAGSKEPCFDWTIHVSSMTEPQVLLEHDVCGGEGSVQGPP